MSDPRRERDPRREVPPVLAHEGQLQQAHSSPERCKAMSMAEHRLRPRRVRPTVETLLTTQALPREFLSPKNSLQYDSHEITSAGSADSRGTGDHLGASAAEVNAGTQ